MTYRYENADRKSMKQGNVYAFVDYMTHKFPNEFNGVTYADVDFNDGIFTVWKNGCKEFFDVDGNFKGRKF